MGQREMACNEKDLSSREIIQHTQTHETNRVTEMYSPSVWAFDLTMLEIYTSLCVSIDRSNSSCHA